MIPPSSYDAFEPINTTERLVLGYELLKIIPTWLAEKIHLLTTLWTDLQIETA